MFRVGRGLFSLFYYLFVSVIEGGYVVLYFIVFDLFGFVRAGWPMVLFLFYFCLFAVRFLFV